MALSPEVAPGAAAAPLGLRAADLRRRWSPCAWDERAPWAATRTSPSPRHKRRFTVTSPGLLTDVLVGAIVDVVVVVAVVVVIVFVVVFKRFKSKDT